MIPQLKALSIPVILISVLMTGCATSPNSTLAVQKENNQFQVTGIGKDKLTAKNNAVKAAQNTCKRSSSPIITNEKVDYNGVLDEQTGKIINQAGSIASVFLGKDMSIAQDTDFNVTLDFYCQ